MVLYIENCKESTQKYFRSNNSDKVSRYKINIQTHSYFYALKANNSKRKLRKQYHLQCHQKIKQLGIILTKEVRCLYSENLKMLLK